MVTTRVVRRRKTDLTGGTDGEAGTTYVPAHEEEDHQAVAASMKMFGKMTRKEEDWFPVSLLCKRFNLRQPHPDRKHAVQGTTITIIIVVVVIMSHSVIPSAAVSY